MPGDWTSHKEDRRKWVKEEGMVCRKHEGPALLGAWRLVCQFTRAMVFWCGS